MAIDAIKKGTSALLTASIGLFAILQAMKRHRPTGGVIKPIIRFKTISVPNMIGLIPNG